MEPTASRLCQGDNQDRLSQLPDSILHHILSKNRLETRHVVRTCILSKRWRNFWGSVPHLYFNGQDQAYLSDEEEETHTKFEHFVTSALLLRENSGLQTFRLQWYNNFLVHAPTHLAGWGQYAVNHNVKKLEIELLLEDYFDDFDFEFPASVFTCQSLEDLQLYASGPYSQLPLVVRLSRLKNLRLQRFTTSSLSLKALICGCPVLEELHIEGFKLEDPDICSSSLRKLTLFNNNMRGTRIRIAAPSLQSLEVDFNDIQRLEVLLENLSSLVKASFQTDDINGNSYVDFDEPELLKFSSPGSEEKSHQNVRTLTTFRNWSCMVRACSTISQQLPTSCNRSPNLKLLTLRSTDPDRYKEHSCLKEWFICHHRKICITAKCGVEYDRITELMTEFFKSKCSCLWE